MDLSLQRRLASEILGVGKDRIWIDPNKIQDVSKALSRSDILDLIDKGIIRVKQVKGQSRTWANYIKEQKKKGRRRGAGSRKGGRKARLDKKENWIKRIRAIRNLLRELKEKNIIDKKLYRDLYKRAKSNEFKSKRAILIYLKDSGILKNEKEVLNK
ncbi:LSU ribosomal protein L19E [Candidatus Nanobsidianus stetteri]|uniref:Large ribosomal subunit protein eL19 n=1 Tax=Nanobsidianus stetteri TaxID=1294122 RepID=R1E564_NANST|nr:LSU ribosomal protein L19E [Candidatus Nanobsidianus stetteri]